MIAKLRSWFYERDLFGVTKLPAFVVSVGNISMGGTGKSPFVMLLAERAVESGIRTAVLSRGYKRRSKEAIVVPPNEKLPPAAEIGDEPWMIKNRVPGISLLVHADRGRKAAEFWAELGSPELVILDDGFQHWRLARDRDVVMIDAREDFLGAAIPLGKLREKAGAFGRADLVVITRSAGLDAREKELLRSQVECFTEKRTGAPWKRSATPEAVLLSADYEFAGFRDFHSRNPVDSVDGREFVLVTGIAKPEGFIRLAQSLGVKIRELITFPDHHPLENKDREKILQALARLNEGYILCTEKDRARWQESLKEVPGVSVEVRLNFGDGGTSVLDQFFDSVFAEARRCSISG